MLLSQTKIRLSSVYLFPLHFGAKETQWASCSFESYTKNYCARLIFIITSWKSFFIWHQRWTRRRNDVISTTQLWGNSISVTTFLTSIFNMHCKIDGALNILQHQYILYLLQSLKYPIIRYIIYFLQRFIDYWTEYI